MQVDWEILAAAYPRSPFLASFGGTLSAAGQLTGSLAQELAALALPQRSAQLTGYLQQLVARVLGMAAVPSAETGFTDLGMDSLMALELRRELERALHCALPATVAFEYPTAATLTTYLLADILQLAEMPEEPVVSNSQQRSAGLHEPIAVVSMACRFPGAETPEAFWNLLQQGEDQVRTIPLSRWQVDDFKKACRIPCKTICQNAGFEGSIVVDKLVEGKDHTKGFDAAKGEYVNMKNAGIVDPTKVVRTALVDASGVASLMITTEAMIVSEPEEKKGGPGGMGGMGGMDGMM
jgi:acyl carrier protein